VSLREAAARAGVDARAAFEEAMEWAGDDRDLFR
jgi:hypothetical protein